MKVLVNMIVWMMGTDFVKEKGSMALLNCAAVSTADIATRGSFPFTWAMDALMMGVGVSYDTEGAGKITIRQPKVLSTKDEIAEIANGDIYKKTHFVIPDSREGWVESLRIVLDAYIAGGSLPTMDYSAIRPYGAPIKGFGGVASGPGPLKILHDGYIKLLNGRIGQKLSSTDIVDLMDMIGVCVVAGNVRRSALLAFGKWDDNDFVEMKNPEKFPEENMSHRWASNNSIRAEVGKTDYKKIAESIERNGEPGLIWLDNIRTHGRMADAPDNKDKYACMLNPCFAPGTLVQTRNGHFPIESLVGKEVAIHDGNSWVNINNFRVTAENQRILNVELQDGTIIKTTPYHSFILDNDERIEAKDLLVGNKLKISSAENSHGDINVAGAYIKGFLTGDGTTDGSKPLVFVYEPKFVCMDRLIKSASEIPPTSKARADSIVDLDFIDSGDRKVMRGLTVRRDELLPYCLENKNKLPADIYSWDLKSKSEFIAGVMDADGGAFDTKNGWMYQLSSVKKQWLLDFQTLLKTIGVNSKISKSRDAGIVDFNDGYGEYETKDCYRLTISQESSIVLANTVRFERLVSFANKKTTYKLKPKWNTVVSITEGDFEEKVYCCTVDTNHSFALSCGIQIGQCAEICLEDTELCNLVETFPSRHDSYEEFRTTLKYAYLYAKTVTLIPTHVPETNAVMMKNRRIGISQSGIVDAFVKHGRRAMMVWSDTGYRYLKELDELYSNWLCIPRSIRITAVKPSGCGVLDSVMKTSKGNKTFEEIFNFFDINPMDYEDEERVWVDVDKELFVFDENNERRKINKLFINGYEYVYEFETEDGKKHSFTKDHKFMVKGKGWVKVCDLEEGDDIVSY